ncbi:nonribosomal peptide synthetase [Aspergillus bombycis]|uniref:Nonribosomal peptide synthetase n=1 Tax=Aspergillus bombycis TaxID=109264 RepID=A0A1F8AEX2_9EURO|nr:nonribosomal peptide synthetase [Aspergillus bombycis]OGM50252.1 nonribosomal peptide synthetase [Aspergillus bombycis]
MAALSTSSLFSPPIGTQRDSRYSETQIATANVACKGLSSKSLARWLHEEQRSHLELLQAAWSLSLRSYTGSNDLWFSCLDSKRNCYSHVSPAQPVRSLFNIRRVELHEENRTTSQGANSAVYVNEGHEDDCDNVRLYDIREFDLAVYFSPGTETQSPGIGIHHKPSVISTDLATMIAETVARAIDQIVLHVDSQIEVLDICSDADINRLYHWNNISGDEISPRHCIHHIISQRCAAQPESIAVSAWDGQLTYAELDSLSSALAIRLQHLGVHPEVFVPLVFGKSKWAVIALLGVLKAGGAYFFLDPSHPIEYSRSLCSSLCPEIVVSSQRQSTLAKSFAGKVIPLGGESCELLDSFAIDERHPQSTAETNTSNAMYITFTSGTTGTPKGIITEHSAFYSMAMANGKALRVTATTRMLQFASYTFDVSNRDMLITLIFGGCICIPSESDRINDLSGFINRQSVSLASLTPSMASTLSPAACPSLQGLVLGGEPMTDSHISSWANHVRLFNAYGVSESTGIAALASDIQQGSSPGNVGFGCGSTLWVVAIDQPDKLAPIGALGELVIEGPSVARGYMGDKKRTEKQFTSKPAWKKRIHEQFGKTHSGKRAFHTGDLVRYNLDGSLHFVGRKDHQVKVNGQRLELTAIEHHIAACAEVANSGFLHTAVVAAKSKANGSKLLAFLGLDTTREPNSPSQIVSKQLKDMEALKAALKRHLLHCLPTYMVPVDFIFLEHMPLTTSGKVNRLRLQETAAYVFFDHQKRTLDASDSNNNHITATPKEKVLIHSWARILGIKNASIMHHDCFFRSGGDSIAAIKMAASLRQEGFIISVSDIFKFSTLSDMASVLVEDNKPFPPAVPASFSLIDNSQTVLDAILEELGTSIDQVEDVYPCTHMQQGLIALTAQKPHAYIGSYTWQLTDTLEEERFKDAWKAVWFHNPILRTRVVQTPDGVFQVVMKTDMPWNTVTDITGCGDEKQIMKVDISHGPLIQFYFNKESFRLDIHHALFDEWSLDLILRQAERAYTGERLHTQPFSPFVQHLLHERDTTMEDFWRQEFSCLQAEHFPASAASPINVEHATEKVVLEHSLQLEIGNSTKYTLSSVLRLAWAIVLWHQTGSEDVLFGATVSGRNVNIDGIDQISGPTLATLPVRIRLPTSQPVHEGLSQVQDQFANMMVYEQTGLSRIRQAGRESAEACNFQNLLVVQPYEQQTTSLMFKTSANTASSSENAKAFSSYPLVLICRPEKTGISMKVIIDPSALAPASGHSILRQMSHVIQQLMTSDSIRITDVSLVPPEDMSILREWNHFLPKAVDTCIHDRIRQLCIAQPEALAIHSNDLDLTYAQLENYSNHFAQHLVSTGVTQGDFIPLLLERSPWVPVIMLAVLKTGAAFVLLDLSHPIQRMRTMCSMLNARIVVSFKEHTHMSDNLSLPIINFDPKVLVQNLGKQIIGSASKPPDAFVTPDAPACVVFSSGSTGLPKGIVLHHSALTTSAAVMRDHGMLAPNSRVFHFASFAFDISIGEILFTLAAGACICVPYEEDRRGNPAKAAGDLQVTWALLTPSVINLFDPLDVPTLEVLGSAGEPLTPHIVNVWAHRVNLFGMYAPAECTVISHIGRILPDTHHSSIGRSPGAVSWVADPSDHNRLVPIGTVGELIVEGPVVSSGYLNDPEKTNKVFITSPPWLTDVRSFSGRLYKTGDLVRQTSDGSLLFVGRKDDQVKLHGQRLEVGEVEHCIISSSTAIRTAAVECIKIPEQNNRVSLAAFICPQTDGDWGQSFDAGSGGLELVGPPSDQFYSTIQALETSLKELLPAYMVPSFFIPLADVPLTLSGKVNRRLLRNESTSLSLKILEQYQLRNRTAPAEEVPITALGREIQQIIGQTLNVDMQLIPMSSNFFGLGGDSISAMQVSMLARRRGICLPVADIFTEQILSRIASKCTRDHEDTNKTSRNKPSGPAMNLSHHRDIAYEKLLRRLPQEVADNIEEALPATEFQAMTLRNFYSRYLWISLPGEVDQEHLLNACNQLVQKHSILRTVFYTKDEKSVAQLTLRKVHVSFIHYDNIENLDEHCADDSLAMGVPIDGEPGFQVQLVTLRDAGKFLVLRLPHALFDGLSLDIICSDLSSAYGGNVLPPCAQFADHVRHVWEKKTPETYNIWKEVLGEAPMTSLNNKFLQSWNRLGKNEIPQMGTNSEQPRVVTAIAETIPISPPPNTTMATLVKLAWAITLSRLFTSAQEENGCKQGLNDVVFGQVVHGRGLGISHEDRIVGPCLNIIPVRVRFPPRSNKFELLGQVQQQHIQTMPVENLGLDEIVHNCTSWEAGTKFGSFVRFQNFTNNDDSTCSFDGHTCETGLYSLPNRPSATANVLVVPHGPTLTITMTISNQVLDRESADYVVGYFSDVIGSLASEEAVCEYLV